MRNDWQRFCNNFGKKHVLYDPPNHIIGFEKDFAYANFTLRIQEKSKASKWDDFGFGVFDGTLGARRRKLDKP